MKVVFCTPTLVRPFDEYLEAMEASVPALDAAGIKHQIGFETGCTYISWARASLLRKALDTQPDAVVFIDHDMSWRPEDLVRLILTPGDVVSGAYRFKTDAENYMGTILMGDDGLPVRRGDGCIQADWIPAGFLKITAQAVHDFCAAYPELLYGSNYRPHIDLFNHGAHKGVWYGEDYAFSRRWNEMGRPIWVIPDLHLTHHSKDKAYPGNLEAYMRRKAIA